MNNRSLSGKAVSVMALLLFSTLTLIAQTTTVSTQEEITEDVKSVVCKNDERLASVKKLFVKMGATEDDIKVEKLKGVENLVITKKGNSAETIIVGAHFDKVTDGCGVLDNWTGIVVLANLYRTFKDLDSEKTYLFVGFGKEEAGLEGSAAMAKAIPKEAKASYCAMVNFDSFGISYPQVMTNTSDAKLINVAKEVNEELKIPFAQAVIDGADADSSSFRKEKIPAITIHGLDDNWQKYLHSSKDNIEKVNMKSVYIAYRYGLSFLANVDKKGCADFRK